MTALIKKSIREEVKLEDYSTIYYKITIAYKYTQGGIFSSDNHQPITSYSMSYPDVIEFFRIYSEALQTDERFNNIEIHFDREMNPEAEFTWDQAYYDADVEGNKKLKKK